MEPYATSFVHSVPCRKNDEAKITNKLCTESLILHLQERCLRIKILHSFHVPKNHILIFYKLTGTYCSKKIIQNMLKQLDFCALHNPFLIYVEKLSIVQPDCDPIARDHLF